MAFIKNTNFKFCCGTSETILIKFGVHYDVVVRAKTITKWSSFLTFNISKFESSCDKINTSNNSQNFSFHKIDLILSGLQNAIIMNFSINVFHS